MPLSIERLTDAPPDWASFVRERGLFYHSVEWIEGLRRCFGFGIHWLVAREAGALAGVLPLAEVPGLFSGPRLVSLPFSYAAGPVATDHDASVALQHEAVALGRVRRISRVEVKQLGAPDPPAPGFQRAGRYATYRLATDGGEDAIWNRLNADSTRRGIRKAEKAGVRVEQGRGADDWETFAALEDLTARNHGLPAPPREFFRDVCLGLQGRGLADLYLGRLPDGRAAAGVVVWKGPREWIYGFNASDPTLLDRRPNHAVLWAAIRDAARAGVVFDLGRAAEEQHSLVEYKRRWGGQPVPLAYDYWPSAAGLNVARRDAGPLVWAAAVWRHLPLPVTRLGSHLYRFLG